MTATGSAAAAGNVRRNTVANCLGQGWTALMNVAFVPVYVGYLGMEAYGLVGVMALLQTWMIVADVGLTPTMAREMARFTSGQHSVPRIRDLLRTVEALAAGISVLFVLAVWVFADWLAVHWLTANELPAEIVARALIVIGAVCAMRGVENIYRSSIVGLQRQVRLNVILSWVATVRAVGAIAVLAWIAPTVTAFFLWHAAVSVLTIVLVAVTVYQTLPDAGRPAKVSLATLGEAWTFAAGAFVLTGLGFILSQTDKIVLSAVLDLHQFGVYTLAFTVAAMIRALAQPIDQAVYPRMVELYQRGDHVELARVYHKAAQYNAVLLGSAGAFLALFGQQVLELWTGDPKVAAETATILWLLSIGMVLNGVINGPYYLQLAAGWTGLLVKINAAMVVVFVPVIYVLARSFGMTGAATGWVLVNSAYVVSVASLMHRRLLPGEMRAWYAQDIMAPLVAGLIAAALFALILPTPAAGGASMLSLAVGLAAIVVASALAAGRVRSDVHARLRLAIGTTP